jgi:predicted NAD/FAD-binding protein
MVERIMADHSASYVDLGGRGSSSSEEEEQLQSSTTPDGVDPIKKKKTVAIIGGGVSGLAAAWHLHEHCDDVTVHLFEQADRLGGHAWTVETTAENGDVIPVDIGFMVYNATNYPNLTAWFQCLDKNNNTSSGATITTVRPEPSNMSLSVSLDDGQTVEWSSGVDGNALVGLFGSRPQQMVSADFISFLTDMVRFNETAAAQILILHEQDPRRHRTTREFLMRENYGIPFQQYYLLPMMAALWSASLNDVLEFPAIQLIAFLSNHQMLQLFDRPIWQTVQGRSVQYVRAVEHALNNNNGTTKAKQQQQQQRIHCNTGIHSIQVVDVPIDPDEHQPPGTGGEEKTQRQYRLFTTAASAADGESVVAEALPGVLFDDIIFACHAPTAQAILQRSENIDKTHRAENLLQDIQYADNYVYVHSDARLMPKSPLAWASWNCLGKSDQLQMTMNHHRNSTSSSSSKGAFEGAESGFGNTLMTKNATAADGQTDDAAYAPKDGPDGRFRAVYVT